MEQKFFVKTAIASAVLLQFAAPWDVALADGLWFSGDYSKTMAEDINATNDGEKTKTAIGLEKNYNLTLSGQNISATSVYQGKDYTDTGAAAKADSGSVLNLGAQDTQSINLTATGSFMNGLWANGTKSKVVVNGQNLNITVTAVRDNNFPQTAGIYAQTNTSNAEPNASSAQIIVNAENTYINCNIENNDGGDYAVSAINATSNGIVEINGNLFVKAPYLISSRGNSSVSINKNNDAKTIQLEGIIQYAEDNDSDTDLDLDSDIVINLKGSQSYWTGALMTYDDTAKELNLGLSDGASWNAVADLPDPNAAGMKVANVTIDNGFINTEQSDQTVGIVNLKVGAGGGTFNSVTEEGADGTFTNAKLAIYKIEAESGANIAVNYTGINADDLTQENVNSLKAFADGTSTEDVTVVEHVEEGDIKGAWTRNDADGSGTFSANTKLEDFSAANAMALVQWRNEVEHLTKRLGDIRASVTDIGVWARIYGGESEWGDSNDVEMDHTTIQVGSDTRISDHWIVGGAFSYTDTDADLDKGSADGEIYSLAAYATYLADGGSYLDLVARYGYLDNEIHTGNMDVDTGSNAFSFSVETGHTFRFLEQAYVEPQIGLTYGFVTGDDDTASNGVLIDQDDFQSLVGRVGVRSGFDFSEDVGTIYAMLSYSYDFLGEAEGTATKGDDRADLYEDLGGGWLSYGIGAKFKLGDSAYIYGELERTSCGEVDNPYLFNVGFRYAF